MDIDVSNEKSIISTVIGGNFSGRTTFLHDKSGFQSASTKEQEDYQYLGSDISNFISGLTDSVKGELDLHFEGCDYTQEKWSAEAASNLLPINDLNQNPFTLSGGEQTLLVILSLIFLRKPKIALDCALEQLSAVNRRKVLSLINNVPFLQSVLIADNRLNEFDDFSVRHQFELQKRTHDQELTPVDFHPYQTNNYLIEIENLCFKYKNGKEIFHNAQLILQPGQIYILRGENGTGKSTLSKILCGILKPDSGTISHNGETFLPHENPSEVFAYHFQNPDLQLFAHSVIDEIKLSAKNKDNSHISLILNAFGLEKYRNSHPMDMSFSLRKRLAIAVTFAMERPWMILDEVTIGQDDIAMKSLAEIIKIQANSGTGIILISHSSDFLSFFSTESILIENGKILEFKE